MSTLATIYPNRITLTPRRRMKSLFELTNEKLKKRTDKLTIERYTSNFKKKNNTFELSGASKKKVMDSINSMFVLSKPRKIDMRNGKTLYNFRMSFVTLTLPSPQAHTDKEIKAQCLNQFLVELKKHYGVNNFVWKAELQKNDNIHFHLVLDRYVDFQALRRRWNRIINKLGYVDAYQNKFSKLSLSHYNKIVNPHQKTEFSIIANRYASGKKSNWSNPNSVDVRSVLSKKDLAVYLSKYIAKPTSREDITEETAKRQKDFGRSWSRSYSLAQLKFKNKFEIHELKELFDYFKTIPNEVKHFIGDYFEVFYFNLQSLSQRFKSMLEFYNRQNAKLYNYPFPA